MSPGLALDTATLWGLDVFLLLLVLERLAELRLSARNEARMLALGGREHARRHFPLFICLHLLFPASLVCEVVYGGTRVGPLWPFWIAILLAAQALRFAAIRALGVRWSVRVWVVPGAPLASGGPYRFIRHPNYLAVAAEMPAAALLFGAWRTAVVFSLLNLAVLWVRIRAEERALGIRSGRAAS